jgi:hypothetical protein
MALLYEEVRKLALAPGAHPRGLAFLSAASGLVRVRDRFYVIADDELDLAVFDVGGVAPLRLIRLVEGELPAAPKKRKALKPDFEALLVLPASDASPHGALLALGSGSRPNRWTGAIAGLDEQGEVRGAVRVIDLAPLYGSLGGHVDALNIEGAFISADAALVLLQRSKARGAGAAIRFDLEEVMAWLAGRRVEALSPRAVRRYDLGAMAGVPLAFTDGAALANGSWVFSAVAEDSDSSYDDGSCLAAAIGIVDRDGTLRSLQRLEPTRRSKASRRRSTARRSCSAW